MKTLFTLEHTLGGIVAAFPGAAAIFKDKRIDFCCGGNRSLGEAVQEAGIDGTELLAMLNKAQEEDLLRNGLVMDWMAASSAELIRHIVSTHHAYLNAELPDISSLVTKILRAHGVNHGQELSRVHKLFHNLKMELEQHLIKEEEVLFPLMTAVVTASSYEGLAEIRRVMKETEDEHDGAGDILKELRKVTNDFTAPTDGCKTYALTYKKLEMLEADLFQHIHLENNILFPRYTDTNSSMLVNAGTGTCCRG